MAIRCLFHVPGSVHPCEVLKAAGCAQLTDELYRKITDRYCEGGAFIRCPLFRRIEQSLSELDQQRDPRRQAVRRERRASL